MNKIAAALVAIIACFSHPAACEEQASVVGTTLYLSGEINNNLINKVNALRLTGITSVAITSHGGSVDTGIAISKFIQKFHMSVIVDDYCESACTIILAAGKERIGFSTAKFLIHGALGSGDAFAEKGDSVATPDVIKANNLMRGLYVDAGMNPYFVDWAVQTPRKNHEKMLSASEAMSVGLLTKVIN